VRERVYVKRARALGARTQAVGSTCYRTVAPLLIAQHVLMVALAIFAETYITFLGSGDTSQLSVGSADRERLPRATRAEPGRGGRSFRPACA